MYEKFRNELIEECAAAGITDTDAFLRLMDMVAVRYDITKKETALVVRGAEVPQEVKTYLGVKTIEGLSQAGLKNVYYLLEKFFYDIRKLPSEVTPNDIRVWLFAYQEKNGISLRTLEKYREYIGRFFAWCSDEGYTPTNPAKNLKKIKHEEPQRQALTQIELEYMRRSCKTKRDRAIVEMLYSTGCRVAELVILTKDDISEDGKSIHLFGKGQKHRTSYINAKAEVALKEYLEDRTDDSQYLFVSEKAPHGQLTTRAVEQAIAKIAQDSGVKKRVTPHVFRHTTATQMLQSGADIVEIQKLLGHESVSTTMIYAECNTEKVREAHQKYVV